VDLNKTQSYVNLAECQTISRYDIFLEYVKSVISYENASTSEKEGIKAAISWVLSTLGADQ